MVVVCWLLRLERDIYRSRKTDAKFPTAPMSGWPKAQYVPYASSYDWPEYARLRYQNQPQSTQLALAP